MQIRIARSLVAATTVGCLAMACTSTSTTSTTPTSTATTPTNTTTTPSSTATSPGNWSCVTSAPEGTCGPSSYAGITNSNGFNTYVTNHCWGDPTCQQTLSANDPGQWQVVARQAAGNTSVRTYPNAQQLMNNWTGNGWGPCGTCSDTPLSALAQLTSTYTEVTPRGGTIAQFAWDIWTNNNTGHPAEIMVWVDNSGRGSGGATQVGTATLAGQDWTIYKYGDGSHLVPGRRGHLRPAGQRNGRPAGDPAGVRPPGLHLARCHHRAGQRGMGNLLHRRSRRDVRGVSLHPHHGRIGLTLQIGVGRLTPETNEQPRKRIKGWVRTRRFAQLTYNHHEAGEVASLEDAWTEVMAANVVFDNCLEQPVHDQAIAGWLGTDWARLIQRCWHAPPPRCGSPGCPRARWAQFVHPRSTVARGSASRSVSRRRPSRRIYSGGSVIA